MQSELNKIPENEPILNEFHETWEMFGKTLQSAHAVAFPGPIDVQKIMARALQTKDSPAPANVKETRRRFFTLRRWAEVSAICTVLLMAGVFVLQNSDGPVSPVVAGDEWDPFSSEIDEIAMYLDNMDQGRSTFDTEIALVDVRLFDVFYDDDWEEDYF